MSSLHLYKFSNWEINCIYRMFMQCPICPPSPLLHPSPQPPTSLPEIIFRKSLFRTWWLWVPLRMNIFSRPIERRVTQILKKAFPNAHFLLLQYAIINSFNVPLFIITHKTSPIIDGLIVKWYNNTRALTRMGLLYLEGPYSKRFAS